MTTVRRALVISFIERYALIALSLASNILIARLLSPKEIGLYSVSLAAIGVAQVLRDFGVGGYLIQEKNLTEAHIRSAFGISLLMGSVLFVLVFLASTWVGILYEEPQMVATLRISSLNFLVLPFCTVSLALLRREMQFQKVLYVTLTATTIGFAVTIALAYAGYGANSMALGAVVTNVVTGFCAWVARGTQKVMLPSLSEWRKVASFGTQRSASGIASTMSSDVSELVAGKLLGFAPVAMLSRAQGLMNLFQRDLMTAISSVAYPAFAKASRENKNLEVKHVAAVAAITVVGWPFFGFVALFGLEILRLLFGRQWDEAAAFVPWYCLAGVVAAPIYLIIPLLTAIGRIDAATKIDLIVQPLRAALFIFGLMLFPSINTPPVLYLIAASCATPYCYYMKGKALPNDMPNLLTSLAKSAAVTAVSLILPIATILTLGRENGPLEFSWVLAAAISCAVSWVVAIYAIRHPITQDPLFIGALQRFDILFWKIKK